MAVRNAANKRMQSRGKASCSRQEPDGRMPSKVWARPFRGTKTALTDSHKALEEDLENEGRHARDGPATATANPLPDMDGEHQDYLGASNPTCADLPGG